MKRNLSALASDQFDILVVGGGIHGACVARDAALRGLSVALIEQSDFCSATSHNSLKTIHGGIRYLQHLNIKRAVESVREQQVFLRTAPHLVQPLPFLMPTYGWGMRGPVVMAAGIALFELMSALTRLSRGQVPGWPRGRILSRKRCLEIAPGIDEHDLTGGAIWSDAQVAFADKAVLQMLQQAEDHKACVANHVRARELLKDDSGQQVLGVVAEDAITGNTFKVHARLVINAAGPWVGQWIGKGGDSLPSLSVGLVKSMNLVSNKPAPPFAIGVKSQLASDSRVDKAKRLFFSVPWQGKTIIGTTHFTHRDSDVDVRVEQADIDAFVEEFSEVYPGMNLQAQDILYCYQGLTPGDDSVDADGAKLHHSKVVDHAVGDGIDGLVSIIGIKWTTARAVAERAVDIASQHLGRAAAGKTHETDIPDYPNTAHDTRTLSNEDLRQFVIMHVEHTQALRLTDIVLRRTNDLVLGHMSSARVRVVLDTLALKFAWSQDQIQREIEQLKCSGLPQRLANQLVDELHGVAV